MSGLTIETLGVDGQTLAALLLVFGRACAWLYTAPLTSEPVVPPRLRVAIAALLALAIAPLRGPVAPQSLWLALPGELFLGAGFGFSTRVILSGVEAAGQLIGLELSLGFAGHFDPLLREEALPTRRFTYCLAGLAFIGADGIELSVRSLAHASVDGRTVERAVMTLIDAGGEVLVLALRGAAPFVLAALVANLAGALASRAAPALNVFSVMLALGLIVGGFVLVAGAPALVREVGLGVRRSLDFAAQGVRR